MKLPLFVGTGVVVAEPFQLNAIDFNGSNEYMANTTNQSIGIANSWTVTSWFETSASSDTSFSLVLDSAASPNNNVIILGMLSSMKMYAKVTQIDSIQKQYIGDTALSINTRYFIAATWNGSSLELYLNAVADTPYNKVTDGSPTMSDSNRGVFINTQKNLGSIGTGPKSHICLWDTDLSSTELLALYDSGEGYKLDVRNSIGDYTSTANLKHQWALGKETGSNIGKDYVSSGAINVSNNSSNITDADIVTF